MMTLADESRCKHGTEWPDGDPGCFDCIDEADARARIASHKGDERCFLCDLRWESWGNELCQETEPRRWWDDPAEVLAFAREHFTDPTPLSTILYYFEKPWKWDQERQKGNR